MLLFHPVDVAQCLNTVLDITDILEEYALFTTDRHLPRYYSSFKQDISFYIGTSSHWKPANNATWIELSSIINVPSGMYIQISLDGTHPINDDL